MNAYKTETDEEKISKLKNDFKPHNGNEKLIPDKDDHPFVK